MIKAALYVFIFCIFYAPLAFACTETFFREILYSLLALGCLLCSPYLKFRKGYIYLLCFFGILLCIQIMPIGEKLLQILSPSSFSIHDNLKLKGIEPFYSLSISPFDTFMRMREIMLSLLCFFCLATLCTEKAKRILITRALLLSFSLVLICTLLSFGDKENYRMGLLPIISDAQSELSHTILPTSSAGFAFFKNLNLTNATYNNTYCYISTDAGPYPTGNQFVTLFILIAPLILLKLHNKYENMRLVDICATIITISCYIITKSDAGTVSLLCAYIFMRLCLQYKFSLKKLSISLFAIFSILTIFIWLLFGSNEPSSIYDRYSLLNLGGDFASIKSRWEACIVAIEIFLSFILVGCGLGGYGLLYNHYIEENHIMFFTHNEYAQFFAETGILGVLAIAILIYRLWTQNKSHFSIPKSSEFFAFFSAILGFAIHGLVDWNLHVPANMFLFSVLLALCYGTYLHHKSDLISDKIIHRYAPSYVLSPILLFIAVSLLISIDQFSLLPEKKAFQTELQQSYIEKGDIHQAQKLEDLCSFWSFTKYIPFSKTDINFDPDYLILKSCHSYLDRNSKENTVKMLGQALKLRPLDPVALDLINQLTIPDKKGSNAKF